MAAQERRRRKFAASVREVQEKASKAVELSDHLRARGLRMDTRDATVLPDWGPAEAATAALERMKRGGLLPAHSHERSNLLPVYLKHPELEHEREHGDDAIFSQFAARRREFRRSSAEVARRMSGGERRSALRAARLQDGDGMYLGFGAFGAHETERVTSFVASDEVYSAIDSGTTLTIVTGADGSALYAYDPSTAVKIMGFNGSITSSSGRGEAIGLAQSRDGRRVLIRIPGAHVVEGAPNDLLSVSGMLKLGYEFHFAPSGSWIVNSGA